MSPPTIADWPPLDCAGCVIPIPAAEPVRLCLPHEAVYLEEWEPAGVPRSAAVRSTYVSLRLSRVHAELTGSLLRWRREEQPGFDLDVAAAVERELLARTDRQSATRAAVRLTPALAAGFERLTGAEQNRLLVRVALDVLDFRCPPAAALAWRWSGVGPAVANVFEDRMIGEGPTRCQPADDDEARRDPAPYLFRGWRSARAWQTHLQGRAPDSPLDPSTLADIARVIDRDWAHLRMPSSLYAYRRLGFDAAEAAGWHRLLTRAEAVSRWQPAARAARNWRDEDFTLVQAMAWIGVEPEVLAEQTGYASEPWAHAELRDAGFPDLERALPWLEVWDRCRSLTPADLHEYWQQGVPPDWVDQWARGPWVMP